MTTLKQRIEQHDKEIAEIRALQLEFRKDLKILDKAMIDLVNQQAETRRSVKRVSDSVDRFIRSLEGKNGYKKRS